MSMHSMRRLVSTLVLGSALFGATGAWATVEVAGVPLEESVTVAGVPLVLNGAGYRKRGYFKIDVTALYTTQKVTSIEALEKVAGPKRIQLTIQQDITGSQASRHFLIDFEAAAAPGEFAQLITEVSMIGDIYSSLPKIKKGDVVTPPPPLDWVPRQGPAGDAQRQRPDWSRCHLSLHEQRAAQQGDVAHVCRGPDPGGIARQPAGHLLQHA